MTDGNGDFGRAARRDHGSRGIGIPSRKAEWFTPIVALHVKPDKMADVRGEAFTA